MVPTPTDPMEELFALFRVEGREHVARITELLLALEQGPLKTEEMEELFRAAHSLKGAASTLGVDDLAYVAHALEDLFGAVKRKEITAGTEAITTALTGLDVIVGILESAAPGATPNAVAAAEAARIREWLAAARVPAAPSAPAPAREKKPGRKAREAKKAEPAPEAPKEAAAAARIQETVRVPTAKLDAVVNAFEGLWQAAYQNQEFIARIHATWERARRLDKELGEAAAAYRRDRDGDVLNAKVDAAFKSLSGMGGDIRELDFDYAAAVHQAALGLSAFGDDVGSLRMAPVHDLLHGFRRLVRDLGAKTGKRVALEVSGEENELDMGVIELIRDPLNHLIRNAVYHGLEDEDARLRAGKPPVGVIRLATRREGSRYILSVEDDGAGLDLEAVKNAAVEQGALTTEAAATITPGDTARLIFTPGLTTLAGADAMGGRGVGLDVVAANVAALGGNVDVWTEAGVGTRFELRIPSTLAIARGMYVTVGETGYILPSATVRSVLEVSPEDIQDITGRPGISFDGKVLPLGEARALFGGGDGWGDSGGVVVILEAPSGQAALAVSAAGNENEFLMKDLGAIGKIMPLFTGVHITGTGAVVLVLNADTIVRAVGRGEAKWEFEAAPVAREVPVRTVLVVDDSLTTRSLEKNILEAAGYRVVTATDGVEALDVLATTKTDVIIVDVQMPRMDGFELTRRLRASAEYAELPIVLLTSMNTQADVTRGLEAGADAYIRKSQFDQREFITTVEQLI